MTGEESLFSFIKPPEAAGAPQRGHPAPPPMPPPPPRQDDKLAARISELEARLKGLEAKEPGPDRAMVEGLKAEVEASQRRNSEFERAIAALQKGIGDAIREKQAAKDDFNQKTDKFLSELSVLRYRADAADQLCSGLNLANLDDRLYERVIKMVEGGVGGELRERYAVLDAAFAEVARKANQAFAATTANTRRVDKIEERAAIIAYLESRLESHEKKIERLYDIEAISHALKMSVESVENKIGAVMQETAGVAAENKKFLADFESLSHQVKQLTALFTYFRTELAYLLPKKKDGVGESR